MALHRGQIRGSWFLRHSSAPEKQTMTYELLLRTCQWINSGLLQIGGCVNGPFLNIAVIYFYTTLGYNGVILMTVYTFWLHEYMQGNIIQQSKGNIIQQSWFLLPPTPLMEKVFHIFKNFSNILLLVFFIFLKGHTKGCVCVCACVCVDLYSHMDMQWWCSLFLQPSSHTVRLSSSSMSSRQIGHICSSSSFILQMGHTHTHTEQCFTTLAFS